MNTSKATLTIYLETQRLVDLRLVCEEFGIPKSGLKAEVIHKLVKEGPGLKAIKETITLTSYLETQRLVDLRLVCEEFGIPKSGIKAEVIHKLVEEGPGLKAIKDTIAPTKKGEYKTWHANTSKATLTSYLETQRLVDLRLVCEEFGIPKSGIKAEVINKLVKEGPGLKAIKETIAPTKTQSFEAWLAQKNTKSIEKNKKELEQEREKLKKRQELQKIEAAIAQKDKSIEEKKKELEQEEEKLKKRQELQKAAKAKAQAVVTAKLAESKKTEKQLQEIKNIKNRWYANGQLAEYVNCGILTDNYTSIVLQKR